MNEDDLKDAGLAVRQRVVAGRIEYHVMAGRRVISQHVVRATAVAAAMRLISDEQEGN